jgi:outer membrane immunogenic protein
VEMEIEIEMRRRALAAVLLPLFATPSFAADMAVKAPPPVAAPTCAWCGWYVGVNAGYGWSNDDPVNTQTTNVFSAAGLNGNIGGAVAARGTGSVSPKSNSFIGGGQFGYNHQFNNYVLGIETDIQGAAHNTAGTIGSAGLVPGAATPISSTGTITSTRSLDYLGTLRGRVGVVATPQLLAFATGGFAYGGVKTSTRITETLGFPDTPGSFGTAGSSSTLRAGWTAGGGFEWMFAPKWSAKAEYLYYDLGRVNNQLPNIQQLGGLGTVLETTSASQSSTRFTGSVVRVGINYHLN